MENWEEYIRIHKIFKPVNTDKEIDILKERYNSMVQWEKDQNYLFPISTPFSKVVGKDEYGKILENHFQLKPLETNEIRIMVLPSFEPEFQIIIRPTVIIKQSLTSSLWQRFMAKKSDPVKLIKETFEVKNAIKIYKSTEILLATAKCPKEEGFILDGVEYYFFNQNESNIFYKCHSPNRESPIGKYLQELYDKMGLTYQD